MNILYICDEYPPGLNGGIGTAVQLLSREMVKQGHNVYVIGLYSYYYGQADYENDHGVHVYRKRYGIRFSKNNISKLNKIQNRLPDFLQKHLYGKRDSKKFILFLKNFIKDQQIEILEIPDWNTFTHFLGLEFEWPKFDIPSVVKCHGSYTKILFDTKQRGNKKLLNIDKKLLNNTRRLIAVSNNTSEITKNIFKIQHPIKVIYNGINIKENTPELLRQENKIIFFGSLMQAKGIYSLIKAWNIVNAKRPDTVLYIYGKGKINELESLLDSKVRNSVKFMGHVERSKIDEALSTSTIAVFPSYSETFGLTVIEAINENCPVIYTKRSCGPEIINEFETGLLIDPDNIEEIAEKIDLLLNNKELREQLVIKAKEDIKKRFNITETAKTHFDYYQEIINKEKL